MRVNKKFKLEEYKEYPYEIEHIYLNLSIHEDLIHIESLMNIIPKSKKNEDLILKGVNINLKKIILNGNHLSTDKYHIEKDELIISSVPIQPFKLEISNTINPYLNTSLEGLYSSSGIITSQCEAEGFRRICFHPDRPDVLSKFTVRIEADLKKYPILLSNGNKLDRDEILDNSRHSVTWEDPYPKPSYLFALVAGQLKKVSSSYKTSSGKDVSINLFVEKGDQKYTSHAIESLKKAMKWEEDVYKLEYDLNLYNIVAIRHFNMGAMENKSLNIFNSKLVLADKNITTDIELERIESVIAHEYFHNWTGNRITCRDWFQLSLKEGLTVFRDQSFTADLHSSSLKRIEDVSLLRTIQFKEDAGPTSHPVKPSEYIAIDNFYTTTIYEKGAEIIRMLYTMLGHRHFMLGVAEYINKFDGCAATTEDFVYSVIFGAQRNGCKITFNIDQFNNWYYQSGTPLVSIKREWNKDKNLLRLIISQKNKSKARPMVIPIRISILNDIRNQRESTLILDKNEQTFEYNDISTNNESPIISVFRDFSAPVSWNTDLSNEELFYICENDENLFSRWNSINLLTRKALLLRASNNLDQNLEDLLVRSFKRTINNYRESQKGFIAEILKIPLVSELEIYQHPIDPINLNKSYISFNSFLGKSLDNLLKDLLEQSYKDSSQEWPKGKEERKLIEVIWALLILNGNQGIKNEALNAIKGSSMTLSRAALNALIQVDCPEREKAMKGFYERWETNPVVLDTWFNLESTIARKDSIQQIKQLLIHPRFDPIAPNSIRAVLGGLTRNINCFHSYDGKGYLFMAEQIANVDKNNPIIASRLLKIFGNWSNYIEPNKEKMLIAIQSLNSFNLSPNTKEILDLMLDT